MIDGIKESNTCMVYFETEVGKMGGKVTDWSLMMMKHGQIVKEEYNNMKNIKLKRSLNIMEE